MKIKKTNLVCIAILLLASNLFAQVPQFGGQVWVEPGQTEKQIDDVFRLMKDNHLQVARLFIMWNLIEKAPDQFDFTCYDMAFKAAEKYDIKILATLTPAEPAPCQNQRSAYLLHQHTSIVDKEEYPLAANYIKRVVTRYKNSPALEYWWLVNEPGHGTLNGPLAIEEYQKWLEQKYKTIEALNIAWLTYFTDFKSISYNKVWDNGGGWKAPLSFMDWRMFWREYLVGFLTWVRTEVMKYDDTHPITVNPHNMHQNWPFYDLAAIRKITNTIGTSMHPSWVLTDFAREKFAFGIAESNDMIRGKVNQSEFWMSELQAGPNTFSGLKPICPDSFDIAQWIWTSLGSGSKRFIYWIINPRPNGGEAGEWALFALNGEVSDRSATSKKIAETIHKYSDLFANAKPLNTGVTILITPESQFFLDCYARPNLEAVGPKSLLKSFSAWHQMFMRLGMTVQLMEARDYDWNSTEKNRIVIFPNALCVPAALQKNIFEFVANGNKIIADGQSFNFDDNITNLPSYGSPFDELFGAKLKDIVMQIDPAVKIPFNNKKYSIYATGYKSEVIPTTAQVLAGDNKIAFATRNQYKNGEAVWIPQQIGVSEFNDHTRDFGEFVLDEVKTAYQLSPVILDNIHNDVLLQTLQSGSKFISIVTNCSFETVKTKIICREKFNPKVIWGSKNSLDKNNILTLGDRDTVVIIWE